MTSELQDSTPANAGRFQTTHWSVVLSAARNADTCASDALAKLCQVYWYPLYAFVRRRGYGSHDAQDLTQEFFARLLEKHYLSAADRSKGKFRTFLLAAMEHFLANEWHRAHRQKRGGNCELISLDTCSAEERYLLEPVDPTTPEKLFERQWVLTLLDQVMARLAAEHQAEGKLALFEQLRGCLSGDKADHPYAEIAASFGLTEGAVKVVVHRLRKRYRDLIQEEIANTVADPSEIDDEIRHLFLAFV